MGAIIKFFKWLWDLCGWLAEFLISLPGIICTAIAGIVSGLSVLSSSIKSFAPVIIDLISSARSRVQEFVAWLSELEYYGIFHEWLALDVFAQVFTGMISLFGVFLILCVIDFFFQGFCIAIPFLIYKGVTKMVAAVSRGFVKPG